IDAGVDPHTVMQWSGHRTMSMLIRYHIIDLEDLRRAGKRASDYRGPASNVVPLSARTAAKPTTAEPLQETGTGHRRASGLEVSECQVCDQAGVADAEPKGVEPSTS